MTLIGVFLLFYGLWYPLKGDVWAYLRVTGTIYLASISVMLIACCYWKRANSWGAAGAIVVGAIIPIACLVIEQTWKMDADTVQLWRCYSGIAAFWPPEPPWSWIVRKTPRPEKVAAEGTRESPTIGMAGGQS